MSLIQCKTPNGPKKNLGFGFFYLLHFANCINSPKNSQTLLGIPYKRKGTSSEESSRNGKKPHIVTPHLNLIAPMVQKKARLFESPKLHHECLAHAHRVEHVSFSIKAGGRQSPRTLQVIKTLIRQENMLPLGNNQRLGSATEKQSKLTKLAETRVMRYRPRHGKPFRMQFLCHYWLRTKEAYDLVSFPMFQSRLLI